MAIVIWAASAGGNPVRNAEGVILNQELVHTHTCRGLPEPKRLIVESSHDYDAAAQIDRGTWYISTDMDKDKWVVPLHLRIIFPQELPLLIELAGLRLVKASECLTVDFHHEKPLFGRSGKDSCVWIKYVESKQAATCEVALHTSKRRDQFSSR